MNLFNEMLGFFLWTLLSIIVSPGVTINAQLIPYGTKNTFEFTNEVAINDIKPSGSNPAGYKIQGKLTVSSLWNSGVTQLLNFELDSLGLFVVTSGGDNHEKKEFIRQSSMLDSIPKKQIYYLILVNNKITFLITHTDDDNDGGNKNVALLNLKRGLASLFQFDFSKDPKSERDSLGSCSVLYRAKSSTKYNKYKTDCDNWNLKIHRREDGPLGVSVKSSQAIEYDLTQDGHLGKILSTEKHSIIVEAKPDLGSTIESIITLRQMQSVDVQQLKGMEMLEEYKKIPLEADIDGKVGQIQGNLKNLIKSIQSEIIDETIGTRKAAENLLKLVPTTRVTTKEVLTQILKAHSTQNIQKQLIDLLGAAQTEDAHLAITQIFKFGLDDNLDQLERYLQAISIGTRSNPEIIMLIKNELHEASKNEKLIDTTIQTISALANRYTHITSEGFNNKLVQEIQKFLQSELINCETPACREVYIRGLGNLRDPKTITILIKTALEEESISSVAAMKALRSFNVKHFSKENRKNLERIFYQIGKSFDSSARTIALDILLDLRPSKEQLTELLMYLRSNDGAYEVKTYVIQKFNLLSNKCPKFASLIRDILKEQSELNNYHIIAQKGLTTVLERKLLTNPAFNETLLSIQEIKNGILKRGVVDMLLKANKKEMNVFQLGLYTKGLSSFIGGSEDGENEPLPEESEEQPAAGMEISVQGVSFRPLIFFSSQSELMGHVWSGTASEPTAAYQATTLLQDHEEYIILQNGATVYLNILGAKSVDLNGQVQLSIWNRNAHTEISKNYGTAIEGSIIFDASFIRLEKKFNTATEPKLNLIADIDFYGDIMLCLQLSRPDLTIWNKFTTKVQVPGTNYSKQSSIKITSKIPGSTLALNQKNNEMCNKIFP